MQDRVPTDFYLSLFINLTNITNDLTHREIGEVCHSLTLFRSGSEY